MRKDASACSPCRFFEKSFEQHCGFFVLTVSRSPLTKKLVSIIIEMKLYLITERRNEKERNFMAGNTASSR